MSLLEKAARAAFGSYAAKAYPDGPEADYEEVWGMGREGFIDAARAVLLAIREPDENTAEEGGYMVPGDRCDPLSAQRIFTAMIDQILSTGEAS